MKNNMIMMVILMIIIAGAAFFGGMKYDQSQTSRGNGLVGQGQGGVAGQRRLGNRGFGGATVGEIVSIDSSSITVKLTDGSSKLIDLLNSTTYTKSANGSISDLKVGDRVAAFGTSNSDGSISAQNIQLNPMFRVGPRPSGQPVPSR